MERYIYYMGQKNWTVEDYDYLNSFLNKIFQNRNKAVNIERIKHMNLSAMNHKTKAILKAVLMQQRIYNEVISEYKNLTGLEDIGPLSEPLKITSEPCNLFPEYKMMNLII